MANIYAPDGDDQNVFIDLEKMVSAAGNKNVVLGGDFNLPMNPLLDPSGKSVCRAPKSTLTLQRVCKTSGLVHIWKILNPSRRDYTFFSAMNKIYSRVVFFNIQYYNILISKSLTSSVTVLSLFERRRSSRWAAVAQRVEQVD